MENISLLTSTFSWIQPETKVDCRTNVALTLTVANFWPMDLNKITNSIQFKITKLFRELDTQPRPQA